jgi:hypothetical protein
MLPENRYILLVDFSQREEGETMKLGTLLRSQAVKVIAEGKRNPTIKGILTSSEGSYKEKRDSWLIARNLSEGKEQKK